MANTDPNARLAPREFASLLEVAKGIMQKPIPAQHRTELLKLGFVTEAPGGLQLTEIGKQRVTMGR